MMTCPTRPSTSATWSTTSQAAVDFYTDAPRLHAAAPTLRPRSPTCSRGHLRLLLSGPASSAGRPMPDGRTPGPGGWNRIHLIVDDIAAEVDRLRAAGASLPQRHRHRPRRPQILLDDPSGNPIELFQPAGAS